MSAGKADEEPADPFIDNFQSDNEAEGARKQAAPAKEEKTAKSEKIAQQRRPSKRPPSRRRKLAIDDLETDEVPSSQTSLELNTELLTTSLPPSPVPDQNIVKNLENSIISHLESSASAMSASFLEEFSSMINNSLSIEPILKTFSEGIQSNIAQIISEPQKTLALPKEVQNLLPDLDSLKVLAPILSQKHLMDGSQMESLGASLESTASSMANGSGSLVSEVETMKPQSQQCDPKLNQLLDQRRALESVLLQEDYERELIEKQIERVRNKRAAFHEEEAHSASEEESPRASLIQEVRKLVEEISEKTDEKSRKIQTLNSLIGKSGEVHQYVDSLFDQSSRFCDAMADASSRAGCPSQEKACARNEIVASVRQRLENLKKNYPQSSSGFF